MKRFITAMLFSLTVIVCQQPTLFAALSVYTNVASVTADSEEGHRGIPIAGVDRSIPVAGANSGLHSMSSPLFRSSTTAVVDSTSIKAIAAPQTYGLNPKGAGLSLQESCANGSFLKYDHIRGEEDQTPFTLPYWDVLPPDAHDSFSHNPEW